MHTQVDKYSRRHTQTLEELIYEMDSCDAILAASEQLAALGLPGKQSCYNRHKNYDHNSFKMKFITVFIVWCLKSAGAADDDIAVPQLLKGKTHTNNWAVLVDTSRFWFNYRHVANVLSMYRSVKRLGIPDSQIILMVADDMACNPRNPRPATVFNNAHQHINVYGEDVEVDYRGYEVTVENFVRLLTGRLAPSTPRSKRLLTDDGSNILIYMTGHGGDGFLKFQDSEEITNVELADAFEQMWQKKRYNEILFIIDTCQAASMYEHFYSPNILAIASSLVGEDSLSHHVDPAIGVYIIDRFTYYALEFLERVTPDSKKTLAQFLQVCPKRVCISTVGVRQDLYKRDPNNVLVTEFFGSVRSVELTNHILDLPKCGGPGKVGLNDSVSGNMLKKSTSSAKELVYANQLPIPQVS